MLLAVPVLEARGRRGRRQQEVDLDDFNLYLGGDLVVYENGLLSIEAQGRIEHLDDGVFNGNNEYQRSHTTATGYLPRHISML